MEEVEEKLLKVVPAEFKVDCHHWLILHGRYTCIARKPRCGSCIIEDLCEYKEKSIPERKPPYFLPFQALRINKGSDIFSFDHKLPSFSPLRIVDSSVI